MRRKKVALQNCEVEKNIIDLKDVNQECSEKFELLPLVNHLDFCHVSCISDIQQHSSS